MIIRSVFYVLLFATVLFLFYEDHIGQVVIQVSSWRLSLSLWLTLLILIIGYWLIKMASQLLNLPGFYGKWIGRRSKEANFNNLAFALIAFTEGDEKKLKTYLKRTRFHDSHWNGITTLLQASYHGLAGVHEKMDDLLKSVTHVDAKSHQRVSFVKALIAYIQMDYKLVITELSPLVSQYPEHRYLLLLLAKSYWQLGDYQWLYQHKDWLKKGKYLNDSQLEIIDTRGAEQSLANCLSEQNTEAFEQLYSELPQRVQYTKEVVALNLSYLKKSKQSDKITRHLEKVYKTTYSAWVMGYFGTVLTGDEVYRIERVIKYLKERPNDPDLMLCLARLYRGNYQNQEALVYLEHVLNNREDRDALKELACLYRDMQDYEQAVAYLFKAFDN